MRINMQLSPRFGNFVASLRSHRRHSLTAVMVFTSIGPSNMRSTPLRGDIIRTGLRRSVVRTTYKLIRRVHLTSLLFYEHRALTIERMARSYLLSLASSPDPID